MSPIEIKCLVTLREKRIILASGSPRRKDILMNLGLKFDVVPSLFPETLDKASFAHPRDYVAETARQKALEVYHRLAEQSDKQPDLVIAADTVVVLDGRILEKPKSTSDAASMLRSLAGRAHEVYTAVTLVTPENATSGDSAVEMTEVEFGEMSDEMINAYIATGEPWDKAGAYGYQGLASLFVKKINGDYFNVVGFPTNRFFKMLQTLF